MTSRYERGNVAQAHHCDELDIGLCNCLPLYSALNVSVSLRVSAWRFSAAGDCWSALIPPGHAAVCPQLVPSRARAELWRLVAAFRRLLHLRRARGHDALQSGTFQVSQALYVDVTNTIINFALGRMIHSLQ